MFGDLKRITVRCCECKKKIKKFIPEGATPGFVNRIKKESICYGCFVKVTKLSH